MEQAFDTLAFAKRMEAVGFTRQQAEALASEQGKLIDERLATKRDIGDVRADIGMLRQRDFAELRQELAALELKIEGRLKDLQIRIGGMLIALGGILIAIRYFG